MQEQEAVSLVREIQRKKSEWQTIELKSCNLGFPHRIYDTLSSFSNQDDGGTILFGIDENKDYEVVGVYDPADCQKRITEACNQMEPKVRALITVAEINGKNIVTAEIPGVSFAKRPVFYIGKGRLKGSYVRVGDADEPMSEYEVYSYEAFRNRIRDELRTINEANSDFFKSSQINTYLNRVKNQRKNLAENCSDQEILELMGVTKDGKPTIAGIMTFFIYPQAYFPQYCITAIVVPGYQIGDIGTNEERFLDNERITGTISDMLESAVSFITRNTRIKTIIDEEGKRFDQREYPLKAVREAILNMLIHRDYSIYTENIPSSIEIYKDRIVFRNCGGLFGAASINLLGRIRPETRNPALAGMLELLGITENRYSGIPTIYNELNKAGLPKPEFNMKHGEFTVTFYNSYPQEEIHINRVDIFQSIIDFCKKPRSRKEITEFVNQTPAYVMRKYINPLLEQGKLKRTLPDKPRSSKQKFYS